MKNTLVKCFAFPFLSSNPISNMNTNEDDTDALPLPPLQGVYDDEDKDDADAGTTVDLFAGFAGLLPDVLPETSGRNIETIG